MDKEIAKELEQVVAERDRLQMASETLKLENQYIANSEKLSMAVAQNFDLKRETDEFEAAAKEVSCKTFSSCLVPKGVTTCLV